MVVLKLIGRLLNVLDESMEELLIMEEGIKRSSQKLIGVTELRASCIC